MKPSNERPGSVPEWLVERLAASELAPERAAEVRQRLTEEPGGLERLAALGRSNEEILAAHPPAAVVPALGERVRLARRLAAARAGAGRRRTWMFVFTPPVLVLGSLGLMMALRAPQDRGGGTQESMSTSADDEVTLIKGAPRLRVYRKVGETSQPLQTNATARAGDQLQLAYVAAGRRFGAVVSVDGTGRVTFHLPADAGQAVQLRAGGEIALSASYELDAAPGFEKFLFVTSDVPFDASVLAEVATGKGRAPAGTSTISFTLRKE